MPLGVPSLLQVMEKIKSPLSKTLADNRNQSNIEMRSSSSSHDPSYSKHRNPWNNYASARPSTSHGHPYHTSTPINTNPSFKKPQQNLSKNLSDASTYADDSNVVEFGPFDYNDSMVSTTWNYREETELKVRREGENNFRRHNKRKPNKPHAKRTNDNLQPLERARMNQQGDKLLQGGNFHAPKKVIKKGAVEYDNKPFPPPGDASLQRSKHQKERSQKEYQKRTKDGAMEKFVSGWLDEEDDIGDKKVENGTQKDTQERYPVVQASVMNSYNDRIPRRKKKEKYDCVDLCDGDNSATDDEKMPHAATTASKTENRTLSKPFEQRTKKRPLPEKDLSHGMENLQLEQKTDQKKEKRRRYFDDSSDDENSQGENTRDYVESISEEPICRAKESTNDGTNPTHCSSSQSLFSSSKEETTSSHSIGLRFTKQRGRYGRHQNETVRKSKPGKKIDSPMDFLISMTKHVASSSRAFIEDFGTSSGERPSKAAERKSLNVRRSSRLSAQKKVHGGTADSAIDILSSEDESVAEVSAPSNRTPRSGIVVTMDAIRIADDKSWPSSDQKITTHCIALCSDLKEMKFHIESESDGEEDLSSFLALNVKKSDGNGLTKLSNAYRPDDTDPCKRYIVIEFRNDDDFRKLLDLFREHNDTGAFINSLEGLPAQQAKEYCQSLFDDSEKAKKRRFRVSLSSERSGFLKGKMDNDVLLQYPFDYHDQAIIDSQAEGLRAELSEVIESGDTKAVGNDRGEEPSVSKNALCMNGCGAVGDSESSSFAVKKSRFSLQITVADFERLEPGEYLNDTLIDFWLHWIWRNSDQTHVHVFSTQFYTALVEGGPQAVVHWTKNRGINIFRKKFIFIPINKDFHWSLTVIVNPGRILEHTEIFDSMKSTRNQQENYYEKIKNETFPFFLFFDSLKAHRKDRVANTLMGWLNSEWVRVHTGDSTSPFKKPFMQIWNPNVPQQDNGCDCGVFVCRYAYAVKRLSHLEFSYEETDFQFFSRQTSSFFCKEIFAEPFKFGMDDIASIRKDLKTLIRRLSDVFIPWKKEQQQKEKEERNQKRTSIKENQIEQSNCNSVLSADQNTKTKHSDDEVDASSEMKAGDVEVFEKGIFSMKDNLVCSLSGNLESLASTPLHLQRLPIIDDIQIVEHTNKAEPESMDWEDQTEV